MTPYKTHIKSMYIIKIFVFVYNIYIGYAILVEYLPYLSNTPLFILQIDQTTHKYPKQY